jgi:hypothetical protein
MGLNAKVKIKREYYSIEQLSERWNTSNDDILHLGLTNRLKVNSVAQFKYSKANITKYNCQLPLSSDDLAAVFFHKKDYFMYCQLMIVFNCSHKPMELHNFMVSILHYGWTGTIIGKQLIIDSRWYTVTITLDDWMIITDKLTIDYDQKNHKLTLTINEDIAVSYCADIKGLIINTDDIERYEKENNIDDSTTNCDYSQETKASKPSQTTQSSNDCEFSGLLIIPSRIDSWFPVIDDMVRAFYNEKGGLPNEVQAWCGLCENPPAGYGVSVEKEKGAADRLIMQGTKPLLRGSFKKRWKVYATNKSE